MHHHALAVFVWIIVAFVAANLAAIVGFSVWINRLPRCGVCGDHASPCCSDFGGTKVDPIYPRCARCCDHTHRPEDRKP